MIDILRQKKCLSFTGESGCYAKFPAGFMSSVLSSGKEFTIEVEFSTQADNAVIFGDMTPERDSYEIQLLADETFFGFYWTGQRVQGHGFVTYAVAEGDIKVNDGKPHKVAIVREADGSSSLYLDGVCISRNIFNNKSFSSSSALYIGFDAESGNHYQLDLYELRIWNVAKNDHEIFETVNNTNIGNLAAWYLPSEGALNDYSNGAHSSATLYGSPAYNERNYSYETFSIERALRGKKVSVSFDTSRKLVRGKWKYLNPGTADLLTVSGVTLTEAQIKATASSDEINATKTGMAFYQTAREKCFDIPATNEIWIQVDIRNRYYYGYTSWRIYNQAVAGTPTSGIRLQTDGRLTFFTHQITGTSYPLFYDESRHDAAPVHKLYTFVVHMVSGVGNGVMEVWVDGGLIYSNYYCNINDGAPLSSIYIQSDGVNSFFSNLAISNYYIEEDAFRKASDNPDGFGVDLLRAPRVPLIVEDTGAHFYWKFLWAGHDNCVFYKSSGEQGTFLIYAGARNTAEFPARNEIWFRCTIPVVRGRSCKIFVGDEAHASGFFVEENVNGCKLLINGESEDIAFPYSWSGDHGYFVQVRVHLRSGVNDGLVEITLAPLNINQFIEENELPTSPVYSRTGNVNNGQAFSTINILPQENPIEGSIYCIAISDRLISLSGIEVPNPPHQEIDFDVGLELFKSISLNLDVWYFLLYKWIFDTDRWDVRSINFPSDIMLQVAHRLISAPINSAGQLAETSGVQSIQIDLSAQQLTDRLSFTWTHPTKMFEQVRGQYLDYKFDMRIEDTTKIGILTTCHCCSGVDELLYMQAKTGVTPPRGLMTVEEATAWRAQENSWYLEYFGVPKYVDEVNPEMLSRISDTLKSAAKKVEVLARIFNKNWVILFEDFHSLVFFGRGISRTFGDMIRELFGWTSRAPNLMINCYIRGDTVYAIQRGHEANVIDLTGTKHTLPVVGEKLMRLAWGNDETSYTITTTEPVYTPDEELDANDAAKAEPMNDNSINNEYGDDNLVKRTTIRNDETTTVIDYEYQTASNGRKYLYKESTTVTDNTGETIEEREVIHEPLAGGSSGQELSIAKDDSGETTASVVGQKPFTEKPTPWAKHAYMNGKWNTLTDVQKKEVTIRGTALVDTSLPVTDFATKKKFSDAINWLNRKTQETISMDVYDYPHVIDFNDRIIFNGNVYFLESNTVVKTPRIVNKQSVRFVRWY